MIIEISTFQLVDGADESAFREADARMQVEFKYQQRGIVRRTIARSKDGEWIAVVFWESDEDAEAAHKASFHDASVLHFMTFVDASTYRTKRYASLD